MCSIEWLRHAADPKPGEVLLSSREVEAAARGPDGQFRPELASGGLSWSRGRLQTTLQVDRNLGASLTASGDHSEPISNNFPQFGPSPSPDILTPLPFYFFRFFGNSPNGNAH